MNLFNEKNGIMIEGHIKIYDPESENVYVNKRNAIHYENMSIALASCLSNSGNGFIYSMNFGNGGTYVDPTGIITYLTPNSTGINAALYNETYEKIVDARSVNNLDTFRNKTEIRHVSGTNYTDIIVSCLLDYSEPAGQDAFDTGTDSNDNFIFDELGLKSWSTTGESMLLTHVLFHPVQKSLNRLIQVDYTVRIQSLSSMLGE